MGSVRVEASVKARVTVRQAGATHGWQLRRLVTGSASPVLTRLHAMNVDNSHTNNFQDCEGPLSRLPLDVRR
jgi:hypothetical protein